jgi:phosphatidylethanolamine-binding protein
VIDDFVPRFILHVQWPKKKAHASLGNKLKPKHLKTPPVFALKTVGETPTTPNMTYTFVLTDPDAPSRKDPRWAQVCHYIATGLLVPASSTATDEDHHLDFSPSNKGHGSGSGNGLIPLMPYKPPGPPPKTGKHRYVFLVFTPANGTTEPLHLSKPAGRRHWGSDKEGYGVREWTKENGLVPIGKLLPLGHRKLRK